MHPARGSGLQTAGFPRLSVASSFHLRPHNAAPNPHRPRLPAPAGPRPVATGEAQPASSRAQRNPWKECSPSPCPARGRGVHPPSMRNPWKHALTSVPSVTLAFQPKRSRKPPACGGSGLQTAGFPRLSVASSFHPRPHNAAHVPQVPLKPLRFQCAHPPPNTHTLNHSKRQHQTCHTRHPAPRGPGVTPPAQTPLQPRDPTLEPRHPPPTPFVPQAGQT